MTFYPADRIALFIDGANLYSAAKGLNFDIDYKKLLEEFKKRGTLVRAYYYTAIAEDQEYSPLRPLIDWLDYNGFTVVTKPMKRYTEQSTGVTRTKGNMDIEIAVDMMELCPHVDHMVLFSGDGDFRRLVEAAQRRGVRVTVISTIRSHPPMASDDLRRQADAFVDLSDLAAVVGRPRLASAPGRPGASDAGYDRERDDRGAYGERADYARRPVPAQTAPDRDVEDVDAPDDDWEDDD